MFPRIGVSGRYAKASNQRELIMANKTIRVITYEGDGSLRTMEYQTFDKLNESHEKIGIDDSSTDLSLRGMPVYRGLIGPIPEGKAAVRYESPEVFELMTKEWSQQKVKRRRRRSSAAASTDETKPNAVPPPLALGADTPTSMPTQV